MKVMAQIAMIMNLDKCNHHLILELHHLYLNLNYYEIGRASCRERV